MITPIEAEKELELAAQLTPGPWVNHSISVGNNGRFIAEKVGNMDSDKAYVMGLLHDIGRREGIKGILHIFDGYEYMMKMGQTEIARICLTHSFPIKDVNTFLGKYDCSLEQKNFLDDFLKKEKYKIAFDVWGLILFLIIMLPNCLWFAVPAVNDVLRNPSVTPSVDGIASVFQIVMVAALCILANQDSQKFLKKGFLRGIVSSVVVYYFGWSFYYAGIVNAAVILDLCLAPCLAFLLFSISRRNGAALVSAIIFTGCHVLYGIVNFIL